MRLGTVRKSLGLGAVVDCGTKPRRLSATGSFLVLNAAVYLVHPLLMGLTGAVIEKNFGTKRGTPLF